ncbi:hypothetical protein N7466_010604 [Penicillium verhagenii]|uniref:uncharacterized protein n=1 Tax=Penicillium verhagenii TaxID=1562060 RepID=UPI002545586E|nr:uncharacterized protein N7466_010604 [Penicillium verhagenii]KAJ5918612.1 hypothetical protein N7466_010604 [Penicillium verhagenii]
MMFGRNQVLERNDIELWPRRLLHVPTMTSYEWEDGNKYGGDTEPKFNILSYTWGRWEIPDGARLPVQNVTWDIPAIDPARFTVPQFEHVLLQVAGENSWVWLDVACIDQIDDLVKLDEVGRQAGIFNNADESYVWLHGTPEKKLQSAMSTLQHLADRLDGDEVSEYVSELGNVPIHYGASPSQTPACLDEPAWLDAVLAVVEEFIQDKWFSSLWTLQECFLRKDARFLSHEGVEPVRPGFQYFGLLNFIQNLGAIQDAVHGRLVKLRSSRLHGGGGNTPGANKTQRSFQHLLEVLSPLALVAWEFEPMIYHAAARRMTRRPADRVYGIMQVYGFTLGKVAEPDRDFTVEELEDQLGLAISSRSSVMGQYFVHDVEPETGRAWRISSNMHVPEQMRLVGLILEDECTIRASGSGSAPVFQGGRCSMEDLIKTWDQMKNFMTEHSGIHLWEGEPTAVQYIALDACAELTRLLSLDLLYGDDMNVATQQTLAWELVRVFGQDLTVLLLGKLYDPNGDDDSADSECESTEVMSDLVGSIGLIVRPVLTTGGKGMVWQRIGICIWPHITVAGGIVAPTFVEAKLTLG